MRLDQLNQNPWFTRMALAASIAASILVMALYAQIDSIVNRDLYAFSLQFSPSWYNPYSVYTKLIYICLGIPAVFSVVALGLSFTKKTGKTPQASAAIQQPSLNLLKQKEVKPQQQIPKEKPKGNLQSDNVNTCPNCNKTFTRPLVTLNFVNGKPKMENTCPYCNEPIGTTENKKPERDIQAAKPKKQEKD